MRFCGKIKVSFVKSACKLVAKCGFFGWSGGQDREDSPFLNPLLLYIKVFFLIERQKIHVFQCADIITLAISN